MRCGFCFDEHAPFYRELSRCFSIIKIKAGQLHFFFRVEVSSLYIGDSNFDHVPLHSPTLPKLVECIKRPLPCIPIRKEVMLCGIQGCEVMVFPCFPKIQKFGCLINLLFWT
jgi:hypothetical protein